MSDHDDLFDEIARLGGGDERGEEEDGMNAYNLLQYTFTDQAPVPMPSAGGDGQGLLLPNVMQGMFGSPAATLAAANGSQLTTMGRQTSDGRVACPFCGSVAENLGGSKRGIMYTYMCRDANCAQRWNQRREPNAAGDLEISLSKRAIGNEPRRSGGYACGICGIKPKHGHVCLGKPQPAQPQQPAAIATTVAAPATPQLVPQLAHRDAAAALVAASSAISAYLPVTTTPVRVVAQPMSGLGAAAPPPLPAPPLPAPPLPPIAPCVVSSIGPSVDEQDAAAAEKEEEAPAEQPGAKAAVGAIEREDGEGVVEDADEADDDEQLSDEALAAAAALEVPNDQELKSSTLENPKNEMASDQASMNGHEVYKQLKLTRRKVKGDGSCWVYAMLDNAGLLEHGNTDDDPTPRDRGMDALCRIMSNVYIEAHQKDLELTPDEIASIDAVLRTPEYPLVEAGDYGEFGTMTTILGLAFFLKVTCVVWNKKTLRSRGIYQQVVVYDADANSVKEHNWTYDKICSHTGPMMHIEWDGINHYSSLAGVAPIAIDSTVYARLLQVPPVTRQKPMSARPSKRPPEARSDIELPEGWTELSNRIRLDSSKCTLVTGRKTLKTHLDDAQRQGYNAVMMMNLHGEAKSTIKYLKFDFEVTEENSAEPGDFSTVLYVYGGTANKKKKLSAPPGFDNFASCLCGKFYQRKESEMQCGKCGRWCHVSCVLGPCRDEKVAEMAAKVFVCGNCCA